jgi:hypothetical protein
MDVFWNQNTIEIYDQWQSKRHYKEKRFELVDTI